MSATQILMVEDEAAIRDMLELAFEQEGFDVHSAEDVDNAHSLLEQQIPDLILLDWMLPGVSGIDWARRLKNNKQYQEIPIILVTARGEEDDKIRGLEIGADDYVTKPFSPRELIARIKVVLRRSVRGERSAERIELDGMTMDMGEHRLSINEIVVDLSPTEFRLLGFFMTHPDKVYSRSQLLDQVWGRSVYIEERTVDVHIRRLRKILAKFQRENLIQTVRGFGYRFSLKTG